MCTVMKVSQVAATHSGSTQPMENFLNKKFSPAFLNKPAKNNDDHYLFLCASAFLWLLHNKRYPMAKCFLSEGVKNYDEQ